MKKFILTSAIVAGAVLSANSFALTVTVNPATGAPARIVSQAQGGQWGQGVSLNDTGQQTGIYSADYNGKIAFWDLKYHAANLIGGFSFNQPAQTVQVTCQPSAWDKPVKVEVFLNNRSILVCNGTSSDKSKNVSYDSGSNLIFNFTNN